MTDEDIKLLLILKFGSLEKAIASWLYDDNITWDDDQVRVLVNYFIIDSKNIGIYEV